MSSTEQYVDLCAECAALIDPESHLYNPQTSECFCSPDCWAERVL
ncbi:hypothetical protein [Natrinema pallidum]|nr:hypothetical protein [Natrinema pallidum]